MKRLVQKRVWRSWTIIRPPSEKLAAVREDEDGNWWEWVSGGKRVLVRQAFIGRMPF